MIVGLAGMVFGMAGQGESAWTVLDRKDLNANNYFVFESCVLPFECLCLLRCFDRVALIESSLWLVVDLVRWFRAIYVVCGTLRPEIEWSCC